LSEEAFHVTETLVPEVVVAFGAPGAVGADVSAGGVLPPPDESTGVVMSLPISAVVNGRL
jgi:hypothetical protein